MSAIVLVVLFLVSPSLLAQPADQDIARRLAAESLARQAQLDAAITGRVRAALLAQSGLASNAIAVQTHEGRVRLSGFVSAPELVSRAGRVTAGVSGVRSVHNSIAVK